MTRWLVVLALMVAVCPLSAHGQKPKAYRLPSVDLKERVIWGSTCEPGNGVAGLAFGGQDQDSPDGRPHTRLLVDGKWQPIHEDLRKNNPLQKHHAEVAPLSREQSRILARARALYFAGKPAAPQAEQLDKLLADLRTLIAHRENLALRLRAAAAQKKLDGYSTGQLNACADRISTKKLALVREMPVDAKLLHDMWELQVALEIAACALDAEPAPRALSPLVYDPKTKLFVLFGGDHCDFLTNDTWVFDPAKKQWQQRHPKLAPPPRANHTLKAAGDGKITLSGGYTYTSSTDYVGGQYRDRQDGDWVYDVAANTWTGTGKAVTPSERTYRTGPFHPDFYLDGDKPDAAAFQKKLAGLPANTWVEVTTKERLPRLNRDWGTAVLDTDRDMILRWSGGHSAHGGSDVLHFHLATGRWELCFPVEFPLGQLYSNTSYPDGYNFNLRPWITGHTYQDYGYDQHARKMIFTGRPRHSYHYDPDSGDWVARKPKPQGMTYNSCFYTLTLCSSPHGLYCWTKDGKLFHFNAKEEQWDELKLDGKLPGAVVDNSTIVHDSKRDRLVAFTKPYGKAPYDGRIHAVDLKTLKVSELPVKNKEAAKVVPYLCQIRYDPEHDLLLVGGFFEEGGTRRTPAYDCAKDEWVSLKLTGDDPSGKQGRNVSLGMMYDAKRKLFWAVDTNGHVFALKFDPKNADPQPMK
ncbi:MAG: kelch repeat-containing protein [Gemmataceae bacterium]